MLVLRYWHTLRHLRPVQFYGRLWFRLYRPRPRNRRNRVRTTFSQLERLHPAVRNPLDEPKGQSPFPLLRPISMLGPARFRFLNQIQDATGPEAWNDAERDKLWLYNLHYFDDLNAADALRSADAPNAAADQCAADALNADANQCATAERHFVADSIRADWHRALVQRWISENPPGQGNGGEPYPTSLRIVNWVKWLLRESVIPTEKPESRPGTGNLAASTEAQQSTASSPSMALGPGFPAGTTGTNETDRFNSASAQQANTAILNSLAIQAHWLSRRLEHHLLGNHLFANAKALVFAGARWPEQGHRAGHQRGGWPAACR